MKPYIYRLLKNDVQDFHEGCFYLTDQRMAHFQTELYNEKTSDSKIILNAMGVYTIGGGTRGHWGHLPPQNL